MKWWLLAAAACTHAASTGGFHITYPNDTALLHQHFQVKPEAQCKRDDGSDARWAATGARVASGSLPPGIAIEDGAINGTPTAIGNFKARVVLTGVTCAGKTLADQPVDVTINVY
jgi:hypothetical protein